MDKPLRSPLCVTKQMKDQTIQKARTAQLDLNERFLYDCTLPSNMAEGSITTFGHEKMELLPQVLQKSFATIRDNFALVIVNDRPEDVNNLMMSKTIDVKC